MVDCAQGAANKEAISTLKSDGKQHDQRINKLEIKHERLDGKIDNITDQVDTINTRVNGMADEVVEKMNGSLKGKSVKLKILGQPLEIPASLFGWVLVIGLCAYFIFAHHFGFREVNEKIEESAVAFDKSFSFNVTSNGVLELTKKMQ